MNNHEFRMKYKLNKTKSESDPRHILVEVDLIIMIKN
jgi:hypothetical protein